MGKDLLDAVEIVEPPIGELTKQRSSFKRTCLTGCGCIVFLIGAVVIGVKIFIGSGPSTIKFLPANFPDSIPLYEKDSIEQMTFISGKYKDRSMEIAALFPKVILSPILLTLHRGEITTSTPNDNFWKILTTPVGDTRDTIQIEWRNMDAEPSYVLSYYRKELSKRGYTFSDEIGGGNVYSLNFAREDDVAGSLYATGLVEDHPGTDYASLTVNIPSNYRNSSTILK
jgi:hypothetical protein